MLTRRFKHPAITLAFLAVELILYCLILTVKGSLLVACSYAAILLCFLFALLHFRRDNAFPIGALACTVAADFFLVVCAPIQQLYGMVFFLMAQLLYAIHLHRLTKHRPLLALRVALVVAIEVVACVVLRDNADALALVSVAYYANLVINIIESFTLFRRNQLIPIGFVLFLLCDTVIGLQVAAGGYLPIAKESLLHRILFMDFHLSWFFYLPSQVLLALGIVETPKSDRR